MHGPLDGPRRVLSRGNDYLSEAAQRLVRIPPGHPEGYLEAFANVYQGGSRPSAPGGRAAAPGPLEGDFPTVEDGARGVRFIERVVESSRLDAKWLEVD